MARQMQQKLMKILASITPMSCETYTWLPLFIIHFCENNFVPEKQKKKRRCSDCLPFRDVNLQTWNKAVLPNSVSESNSKGWQLIKLI